MTASLSLDEEVKILTPNFVDSSSTITCSHTGATNSYLYDKDNDTIWEINQWPGSRDTIEVTLTIVFNVGSTETAFSMNCFMLFGCNIREMSFDYYTGGTWHMLTDVTDNQDDYIVRYFGAKTASRVRFRMRKTVLPNRFKKISELVVARNRFNFKNYSICNLTYREKSSSIILGDGSEHRMVTRFTTNRTSRYGAMVTFDYLTAQELENLKKVKDENTSFLWMPRSVSKPEEIYLVNWVNPFTSIETTKYWGNGYTLQMELREV